MIDRSAITARIIAFPSRRRVRVLLAGWEPHARRAIESPEIEMVPPRGDDLLYEAFEVAAFDARQDPDGALALLARLRSEDAATPALVLVARGDEETPPLARELGSQVLRAPFTADDVRETLLSLRPR